MKVKKLKKSIKINIIGTNENRLKTAQLNFSSIIYNEYEYLEEQSQPDRQAQAIKIENITKKRK